MIAHPVPQTVGERQREVAVRSGPEYRQAAVQLIQRAGGGVADGGTDSDVGLRRQRVRQPLAAAARELHGRRGHRGAQVDVQLARLRQRRPELRRPYLDVDRQRHLQAARGRLVQLQDHRRQDDVLVLHLAHVLLACHPARRGGEQHDPRQTAADYPAARAVPSSPRHAQLSSRSRSAACRAQSLPGNESSRRSTRPAASARRPITSSTSAARTIDRAINSRLPSASSAASR